MSLIAQSIIKYYLSLSWQGSPCLVVRPQFVAQENQKPQLSSESPATASLPTGPAPPWLHCDAPSVYIHQL